MVVMAHGLNAVLKGNGKGETKTGIGSRRIFPPHFKLQVLDSYRNDSDCKGNQRATARKYGIHRRQIQKWLQAESNLRNSVGKGSKTAECEPRKCGIELALRNSGHRQRDDSAPDAYSQCPALNGAEARVPALSPVAYSENGSSSSTHVPLDFTTHSRTDPAPLDDLSAPMDLSLKRPIPIAPGDTRAPVYNIYLPLQQPAAASTPPLIHSPPSLCLAQPAVSPPQADPDIWDLSTKNQPRKRSISPATNPKPVKLFKPYLDDLHDNSNSSDDSSKAQASLLTYHSTYYNNSIYEYTYTLHELQPKSNLNYYYPINKSYIYPHEIEPTYYEDSLMNSTPLKQRQSYSLDFKLSAIECYYQDEMCRGNQRAVASKYNIHRRQVQKWLKQEDELRQRNDCVKHLNTVR